MNNKTKETIWLISFLVIPLISANRFAELVEPDPKMQILYAGIFGSFLALIGFGVYYLTKLKSPLIRILSILLLFGSSVASVKVLVANNYPLTCQICGYKAIEKDDPVCGNCFEEISDAEVKKQGLNNGAELVYSRQLYVFYNDSVELIDFYNPAVSEEGYEKDKNWNPVITKEDIADVRDEVKLIKSNKPKPSKKHPKQANF